MSLFPKIKLFRKIRKIKFFRKIRQFNNERLRALSVRVYRNAFVPLTVIISLMASFICDRCGKCCVSLGRSIIIERQFTDRDYYCRSTIDNLVFSARVDPAFEVEIADEFLMQGDTPAGTQPKVCPFLRNVPGRDTTVCAIYANRPKVCQSFRCYRMIILDRGGTICGRVIGRNTLRTDDPALETLWEELVVPIPCGDPVEWTGRVAAILADHGYRAEPVQ